jgi:hypothetical protein
MSSSRRSIEMSEPAMFMSEPDDYIAATGLMLGTTESIEGSDESVDCIALIFIDTRDSLHPVIIHPDGELIEYLLGDEFREVVTDLRQKLVDRNAR